MQTPMPPAHVSALKQAHAAAAAALAVGDTARAEMALGWATQIVSASESGSPPPPPPLKVADSTNPPPPPPGLKP